MLESAKSACENIVSLSDRYPKRKDLFDLIIIDSIQTCFFSNWKVRLVDENEDIVNIGVLGEVQVKTYSLLREYKNDEEKTKKLFTADGFMRTGWILLQTLLLQ